MSTTVTVPADIDQLASELADLVDAVSQPRLLSPFAFIDDFIRTAVKHSTMYEPHKALVTSNMKINVEYTDSRHSGLIGVSPPLPKIATFELHQIVTDFFRHDLKDATRLRIRWPPAFTPDLRDLFDTVNLQERYINEVEAHFNRPNVKELSLLLTRHELDSIIRRYLEHRASAEALIALANDYLSGWIEPRLVQFEGTSRVKLERALFLPTPEYYEDQTVQGLLVFLGNDPQQKSVYEIPRDFDQFRALIERNAALRNKVLARIPLYQRLKPGNDEVKYVRRFETKYYWVAPITFHASPDIANALFDLSYQRLLSDIDTLVSTDTERLADSALEFSGYLLAGLSLGITLPVSVSLVPIRLVAAFLLGIASAATDAVRAELEDLPEVAADLYRAAIISALAEVIGPLVLKVVGKGLSALARTQLAQRLKVILNTKKLPSSATPYLIDALERSKHSAKMRSLELKLNADFKKGPQTTQLWVENQGRFSQQFIEPYDITVYRGFVFRGDSRTPDIIFEKGFRLRTAAADLQKDLHQATGVRGGFGGGHDALDPDGRGISTSVFYDKDHVGAFTYGGAKGGHTYLVDARQLDGYHLYANDFAARYPQSPRLDLAPVEINYATDIPASAIVGAYDKNGLFIPNLDGLRRTARINQARLERELTKRTFNRAIPKTGPDEARLGIEATLRLFS
ncbi:hypothetical protein [Pseudomonas caspiana]|uniref:Uncharacterized protein n=1 Tax=Pseudomonas caspiana TaxID=1451454 RepID=A0A1Y3NZJ8_9PSED|nr:hypothetical protein [Pseudomonas caspiana]OUM72995.1 hypothetical protein AUC60_15005 [Pseudomonas caspiana]